MSSGPLVVEFCGLPGSGKSSVAAHTCRALRSAGVDAYVADLPVSAAAPRPARVLRRGSLALRQAAGGPGGASRAARVMAATRPTTRDGVALLAQLLAVQGLISQAQRGDRVALLEEGLVQTLWSVGLRSSVDRLDRLVDWLAMTTRADVVVLVDAPTGTVLDRLAARPSRHSRTQRLAPDRRLPELALGRGLLDGLLAGLPGQVLTVRNDGSVPLADLGRDTALEVLRIV